MVRRAYMGCVVIASIGNYSAVLNRRVAGETKEKEVFIVAQNGMLFKPCVKYELNDKMDALNFSAKNIKCMIITDE